jgi:anti-sigma regulatory factor (Ser/Thr protein kinase)
VGEPIWPGRSPDEIREATRHEALMNLAWPDGEIDLLCLYDAVNLDGSVLADAECTHPAVIRDRRPQASPAYAGPAVPPACERPLVDPPSGALTVSFDLQDLGGLRDTVGAEAAKAGLSRARASEFVIAVNELTSNTVKHARSRGTLRLWRGEREIICEVADPGHIEDPLAGRRRRLTGEGGLGLWIVNQLCDLVELRTGAGGTTVRVHTSAAPAPDASGAAVGTGIAA